jgi:isoquinoline 1-oxidoreductase beta subunit
MRVRTDPELQSAMLALTDPINLSRRRFLTGTAVGALVLGFGLPLGSTRVQAAAATAERGTQVPAFLEIRPDNRVRLLCPFMEGGQGTFTAMAQIIGEERAPIQRPFWSKPPRPARPMWSWRMACALPAAACRCA